MTIVPKQLNCNVTFGQYKRLGIIIGVSLCQVTRGGHEWS
jgi:hypothetical protein